MKMAIELDPKEVEAHLNRLGYYNITEEQLKEFIKDLKKLIKYDQHLFCTCNESTKDSESSCTGTSTEVLSNYNLTSSPGEKENSHVENHKNDQAHDRAEQKYVLCSRSFPHNVQPDNSSSTTYVSPCATALPNVAGNTKKSINHSKQKHSQKTRSVENLQEPMKPKRSFIRPRNIQPGQQVEAPKRCDPVKLYHYYQDIWKQQKVPGECCHSDLRWCIRERMLGEDPHPRPVSRASSTRTLNRQCRKL
ncbi:uncharacterized protein LOC110829687 [Zootermopsis nevadensis]|uniref:Centriolar and ciliogenesis-associated protein HYLS1 C-terminal domain-containing protein n=1 Tax=Zootermopsis nevadensis TaxID=136037 RepID=A0A067RJV4_ZOONE|nr:uncharacterized protein LOC110829687 [Zootermopsis nevadensis]XP_021919370.1 uncharacterized protein LOC110829687 [Zootermopsis nevadensis]KDR19697.1 hypothetical protein L798_05154 [Zootermopsis nevadensis]